MRDGSGNGSHSMRDGSCNGSHNGSHYGNPTAIALISMTSNQVDHMNKTSYM